MSDNHRHDHEPTRTRFAAVDSSTVIEIGDDLFLDTDDVKPASEFTWDNNLGDTQAQFAPLYAGVALSASADGDTDPVRIGSDGIYRKTIDSGTFEVGDLIGQQENSSPDGLLDQEVTTVTEKALATGVVAERVASADTEVLVEIHTPVWRGVDLAPVNIGDAEIGQPLIIPFDYADGAEQAIFDAACPRKIRIVDLHAEIDTAGGSGATIKLDDATNDISDAIAVGDSQSAGDIKRAGNIDNTYSTLSVGDSLHATTGGTQGSMAGTLFITVIPVA